MIEVNIVMEEYYRCQSCYASQESAGTRLKAISLGMDGKQTTTFRLCDDCLVDLKEKTLG